MQNLLTLSLPFGMQLFADFRSPGAKRTLGVPLNQLIDILNVFAIGFGGELSLKYPGPDNELLCECDSAQVLGWHFFLPRRLLGGMLGLLCERQAACSWVCHMHPMHRSSRGSDMGLTWHLAAVDARPAGV